MARSTSTSAQVVALAERGGADWSEFLFKQSERVVTAPDGDCLAICLLDTAEIYQFSKAAALIWCRLAPEGATARDLIVSARDLFDVDDEAIAAFVQEVLAEMLSLAVVIPIQPAGPGIRDLSKKVGQ